MPRKQKNKREQKAGYVGGRPKDESRLSRDPKQIRIRLRRAATSKNMDIDTMQRDMEMLYKKPIAEWDLVELAHGRPRDADGKFKGAHPTWCGPVVQREAKKRLVELSRRKLAGHVDSAIEFIGAVLKDDSVDDNGKPIVDARTKVDAAKFIIEHVIGKPQQTVEVEAVDRTRQMVAAAIVLDDGLPQGHRTTIEGEIVEDDEEEGDDAE